MKNRAYLTKCFKIGAVSNDFVDNASHLVSYETEETRLDPKAGIW